MFGTLDEKQRFGAIAGTVRYGLFYSIKEKPEPFLEIFGAGASFLNLWSRSRFIFVSGVRGGDTVVNIKTVPLNTGKTSQKTNPGTRNA